MPGRSAGDLALQDHRARHVDPQVLVFGLSTLPDQGAVHDGGIPAHCTLGARSGAGSDGAAPGEDAQCSAHPPTDCGACLRHPEILDGRHALPDEATTERENRDESARAGLQPKACDADLRGCTADEGDQGVRRPFFATTPGYDKPFTPAEGRSPTPRLKKLGLITQPGSKAVIEVNPSAVGQLRPLEQSPQFST